MIPDGTRMPYFPSSRSISPREAFLPPTRATSASPTVSIGITYFSLPRRRAEALPLRAILAISTVGGFFLKDYSISPPLDAHATVRGPGCAQTLAHSEF